MPGKDCFYQAFEWVDESSLRFEVKLSTYPGNPLIHLVTVQGDAEV